MEIAQVPLSRAQRRAAERAQKRGPNAAKAAMAQRLERGLVEGEKLRTHRMNRALKSNDLPFSHALNRPRIAKVFDPLEKILTDLCETGEIDALPDGTVLLHCAIDGHYYPFAPAIESMCDTFDKLARTHGWSEQPNGMRKLGKRFELAMPVCQEDVDAARATIAWMRQQILGITPNQFSAEAIEVQIRDAMRGQ